HFRRLGTPPAGQRISGGARPVHWQGRFIMVSLWRQPCNRRAIGNCAVALPGSVIDDPAIASAEGAFLLRPQGRLAEFPRRGARKLRGPNSAFRSLYSRSSASTI